MSCLGQIFFLLSIVSLFLTIAADFVFIIPFVLFFILYVVFQQSHLRNESRKRELHKKRIVNYLKRDDINKLPASDIDYHLGFRNVKLVKLFCEELYRDGRIHRTGNYRYFIASSENKSKEFPKKSSININIQAELKELKLLLDEGLISNEQYQEKSDKLLGI